MATVELPLDEIDYEKAYSYDAVDLQLRLGARTSIIPPALVAVAEDVRESFAPAGRQEAARELRGMRRVTFTGLAGLLRRAAAILDRHA